MLYAPLTSCEIMHVQYCLSIFKKIFFFLVLLLNAFPKFYWLVSFTVLQKKKDEMRWILQKLVPNAESIALLRSTQRLLFRHEGQAINDSNYCITGSVTQSELFLLRYAYSLHFICRVFFFCNLLYLTRRHKTLDPLSMPQY